MGLKIEYETPAGIPCPDAYALISGLRVEKQEVKDDGDDSNIHHDFLVSYNGKIYFNQEMRKENRSPVGGVNGQFILSEGDKKNHYNILKQAYLHLKDTDEMFANAEDC
tara:strand:+ start:930 stop:1256 length:327 start_codon:yes stop_codon:yes gene_type:complete